MKKILGNSFVIHVFSAHESLTVHGLWNTSFTWNIHDNMALNRTWIYHEISQPWIIHEIPMKFCTEKYFSKALWINHEKSMKYMLWIANEIFTMKFEWNGNEIIVCILFNTIHQSCTSGYYNFWSYTSSYIMHIQKWHAFSLLYYTLYVHDCILYHAEQAYLNSTPNKYY